MNAESLSLWLRKLTCSPEAAEIGLYQTSASRRFIFKKLLKNAQITNLTSLRHKQKNGLEGGI